MQSENVMYYVDVMPSTIEQLKTFEAKFVQEMECENPLKIAVQLKAMEELVSNLRKNECVREYIMSEVDKYPEKTFEANGATFEKSETGVKYDYSKCGDSVLSDLETKKKEIDKELKVRQKFLQTLDETTEVFSKETGELLSKPLRTSNTYVKVSLK